jgi:hypothetical protein
MAGGNGVVSHESPTTVRSPRVRTVEHRWYLVSLGSWVSLILVVAWVSGHDTFVWRAVAGPLNAIAGAFGAVVLGAFLFNRWSGRVDSERAESERRQRFRRQLGYADGVDTAVRVMLADMSCIAFRPVATALGDRAVPEEQLRQDILRTAALHQRRTSGEVLVAGLREILLRQRMFATGPVATALLQVEELRESMKDSDAAEEEGHETSAAAIAMGLDSSDVLRLGELAERVLALTNDAERIPTVDPVSLRKWAISLLVWAGSVAEASSALKRIDGKNERAITQRADDLLHAVWQLLLALNQCRIQYVSGRESLIEEAQSLLGDKEAQGLLERTDAELISIQARDDANTEEIVSDEWLQWRVEHGYETPSAE